MSELPSGWVHGSLGDVLRIRNGYAFKSAEFKLDGVPLVRQSNLDGDKVDLSKCVYLDKQYLTERAGFTLNKGDVLIGMSGSVGKLCTYDQDFVALQNQRVGKIELHTPDQTEWRFIWHYLKTVTAALLDKAKGVAVANVSPDDIHSLPLNIPPLAEQTRIAAKIDELLAQVDTLKARIDGIPTLLKRFRQSVLAAAVSGRLTEEWRDQHPEIVGNWSKSHIGEVAFVTKLAGFEYTKFVKYKPDGDLKVIKAENAGKHGFKYTEFSTVYSEDVTQLSRTKLFGGELLMVFVGAGTGQVALVPQDGNWFLGPNIAMIKPNNEILSSKYLEHYCRSPIGLGEISSFMKSTAQPSLSMKTIRLIQLPLPPMPEQIEIVRRVEQLFAFADQLETKVASAKSRIDHLTQSILAKAFRGELVPQDPNDEPASVLLERIKAQRAAAPKAKRGRKSV